MLAELTDKNANVFYELGLAHAARKPVVFTAAQVEDVPFDLRHYLAFIVFRPAPIVLTISSLCHSELSAHALVVFSSKSVLWSG